MTNPIKYYVALNHIDDMFNTNAQQASTNQAEKPKPQQTIFKPSKHDIHKHTNGRIKLEPNRKNH